MQLDNTRFYQILSLPRTDATPEEIKRAYKRQSLKYHPDRNAGSADATAKFQEVVQAYGVLSTPRSRQIYDSYGEQGFNMYESFYKSYTEGGEGEGGGLLPGGPGFVLMAGCAALSLMVALATALGVVAWLRLDGSLMGTPVAILLIPLWIMDAVVLAVLYMGLVSAGKAWLTAAASSRLGEFVCFIVFQVLFALRVDAVVPSLSYSLAAIPLFALHALNLCRAALRLRPAAFEGERAGGRTLLPYPLHAARTAARALCPAAASALIALKLDGNATLAPAPWLAVLSPLWAALLVEVAVACGSLAAPVRTDRDEALRHLSRGACLGASLGGALLLLATLRLDETIGSWLPVFLLFFVAAAGYFCCCLCMGCLVCLAPRAAAVDVPLDQGDGFSSSFSSPASTARAHSPAGGENSPLLPAGAAAAGDYRTGTAHRTGSPAGPDRV
jgi:hypothetical protein